MPKNVEIFPWNDNFVTGIATIDEQHQELVRLINLLASHVAYQSGTPEIEAVFEQLKKYADYHFRTEEAIWQKYLKGDDWFEEHQQVHEGFLGDVLGIKEKDSEQPLDVVLEDILSFLTHWLAFHILDSDKRMANVILAMEAGETREQAKQTSTNQMNGAMRALIETILGMYDNLSVRTLQLIKEIAERERIQAKLELTNKAIENSFEAIFITDDEHVIIDANPAFCVMVGYSYQNLLGKHINDIKPVLSEEPLNEQINSAVNDIGHWAGEVWSLTADGSKEAEWLTYSSIKTEDDSVSNFVGIFSSMSQLVERQNILEYAANYDLLTDLPNRRMLTEKLQLEVNRASRYDKQLAVCFLDLDGFKAVNDTFGHDAGDMLLIEIAARLKKVTREIDLVSRIGGDEFVLVFNDFENSTSLIPLLEKILQEVSLAIDVGEKTAFVTASIGVAIYPDNAESVEGLLVKADKMMYQAKQAGKSCFRGV